MVKELRYLLLIATIIFAYGTYSIILSTYFFAEFFLIITILCYSTVVSLLLKKQWSKYLVYLIAIITSGGWAFFTYNAPYLSRSDIASLALIGASLITFGILSSIYVYKYFKDTP